MPKHKHPTNNKQTFFQPLKTQIQKTTSPTKQELFKYTLILLPTLIFFIVFFWLLDVPIPNLIQLFT
ncbi:preprotein translocase subunit SecE [Staphylococcus hominis]|uniref:preprotein translocase subunit SecE n=1 Tax=Staphylococcus hominis TaxID=1290 RepID=UPI0021B54875|nr:preprotein translocase subunit SecE [Staphylococcus hominis]